jgi:flavodoxin
MEMNFAVLYDSETGNTKKIAEQIYETIDSGNKEFIHLKTETQIPRADIYFVGFPIHKNNCSMKIVDALEQIESGKIVLFATCGMKPTEKYKQKLEDFLNIWLPDEAEYLGLFLCQGKTAEEQKEYFCNANPEYRENISEMLEDGNSHPDEDDFEAAIRYTKSILEYYA